MSQTYIIKDIYGKSMHPKRHTPQYLKAVYICLLLFCQSRVTYPPGQNGILIPISLKFVPKNLIDNKPMLVQVMAWCRKGGKSVSEPMLTQFTDAYMRL